VSSDKPTTLFEAIEINDAAALTGLPIQLQQSRQGRPRHRKPL